MADRRNTLVMLRNLCADADFFLCLADSATDNRETASEFLQCKESIAIAMQLSDPDTMRRRVTRIQMRLFEAAEKIRK